ncbi:MAG: TfoX/Sxy family protein [Candidatus Kariarchaeaceae archaeon]|jgi:TfoX/Sxy family transcriptional regulator of competence genes
MSGNNFVEEIKSKLEFLGPIATKNMFGTIAFVRDGVFFGSISKDKLYFKVDDDSVKQYEDYGMQPFTTRGKSMDYFEIPPEILDDISEFKIWAKRALDTATYMKKK